MSTAILVLIAAVSTLASATLDVGEQGPRDYTRYNVCDAVPGDAIGRALGATLVSARPTFDKNWSRCTYFVKPAGSDQQRGYVVWLSPADDFETIKPNIDAPISLLTGLGDGAFIFQDKGDGRFKIYVLMRGVQTVEITGETPDAARKVAAAVLAVLGKKPAQ